MKISLKKWIREARGIIDEAIQKGDKARGELVEKGRKEVLRLKKEGEEDR